jgi:hypothetical protein
LWTAAGQRTVILSPANKAQPFLFLQRPLVFQVAQWKQSESNKRQSSEDSGGKSWSHQFFNPWSHAGAAAMSGVMVFASTEELKAEQAAGNQMLDMMAPMLSQLSLGSALVRL